MTVIDDQIKAKQVEQKTAQKSVQKAQLNLQVVNGALASLFLEKIDEDDTPAPDGE